VREEFLAGKHEKMKDMKEAFLNSEYRLAQGQYSDKVGDWPWPSP
jgi:hypothetical protein